MGFLTFTLVPVTLSLYYSFCDYSLLQPPVFSGLTNYRQLFADPIFAKVLGNTLLYAGVSVPLCMSAALATAILLNASARGQTLYRAMVFIPSIIPAAAAGMLWLWLFNPKIGLVNMILRAVGVSDPPGWLGSESWAMPALILVSVWGVGNAVVIYLAGLQDVPRELYEAAEIDGAGPLRQVVSVTLPVLSPVIFFNLVMSVIGTMQVFVLPFIMTKGGPARSTYFYTMYLYDNAFQYLKMGYASAMAWVQLLIILALTCLAFLSGRLWVHQSR